MIDSPKFFIPKIFNHMSQNELIVISTKYINSSSQWQLQILLRSTVFNISFQLKTQIFLNLSQFQFDITIHIVNSR